MKEDAAAENLKKVKEENKDNVITDYLGTALSGAAGVISQVGADARGENQTYKTDLAVYQRYTPEAQAAVNQAQREYDLAKDNTMQAMIAKENASRLSKYDADAELSKLKAQQAQEQAAKEQAARQGEQAKEQATNRAETSASGGVIHGGPTVSEAR